MTETEPQGCLATILSLFGVKLGGPADVREDLPYRTRDDFLSAAEFSFYRVLANAVGNRAVVCCKVNLADVFFVARPHENQKYRNKIDRKHVDFLLCDPVTMKPRCGVELDDSSHARSDRQDRDAFVDQVFEVAGLPLVRVAAKQGYHPATLLAMMEPHLSSGPAVKAALPAGPGAGAPTCPKCGVPMVPRVATKGAKVGEKFFGCPNFPKCREMVQATGA